MSATEWLVQIGAAWAVFLAFAYIDLPTILDRTVSQLRQQLAPPADGVER
ncbi:hypothetical protein ACFRIC_09145 [Streptomyces sp. NPDC056738]